MNPLEYLNDVVATLPYEDHGRFHRMLIGALSLHVSDEQWRKSIDLMANYLKGLEK